MNTPLKNAFIIFYKEMMDNLRDRRSLVGGIASALFTPALLVFVIIAIGQSFFRDQIEKPLELPVRGAQYAPTLIQYLQQHNVQILPAPADPEVAVRNGDVKLVLIITEKYGGQFQSGQPAALQLVIDSSRQASTADISRANRILEGYGNFVSSLRLMARGVDPIVISPLSVEQVDMATPETQSLLFINMLPYFLILILFSGGQHIILDGVLGEKERGSLEPLLITPVPRWVLMVAKMAASLPFTILILVVELIGFAIAFIAVPLEDFIGFQLTINPQALAWIFLVCLPMTLLAASLQMLIATFARSQREAQTYASLVPLLLALPGLGLAFVPIKPTLPAYLIPTFGQQILMTQLLRSEPINLTYALLSSLVTLLTALLLGLAAGWLFSRERMIFGTR